MKNGACHLLCILVCALLVVSCDAKVSDAASSPEQFSPEVFYDVYMTTRNEEMLVNAAALFAANGEIEKAATLPQFPRKKALPIKILLFWGALLLDAGYAPEALEYIEAVRHLQSEEYALESLLLQADALGSMGDFDAAQAVRDIITQNYKKNDIPPVVFYNSARYAKVHGDTALSAAILGELVQNSPEYAPGLAALGELALQKPPETQIHETGLEDYVRASGLRTREMEEARDTAVQVPVQLVLNALEEAQKRNFSVEVLVEELKFKQKLRMQNGDTDLKFPWLWDALEEHLENNTYPPELAHYAVTFLFANGQTQPGTELFERYFKFRYNGADPIAILPKLASWEIETLAWIAGNRADSEKALRLYRYLCDSYKPPQHIFVNYAEVLQGTGRLPEAAALYQKALEIKPATVPRDEILYRLGRLQFDNREFHQAVFMLEECLTLNPNHQKARILMRQISAQ
jgi:tetratricopeptide (TPR) repeat protein